MEKNIKIWRITHRNTDNNNKNQQKNDRQIEKITINSGINNLEQWDSLAHLSILNEIDDFTKGKASKIRGLSNATTVKEILRYDESFLKRIRKIQHYF